MHTHTNILRQVNMCTWKCKYTHTCEERPILSHTQNCTTHKRFRSWAFITTILKEGKIGHNCWLLGSHNWKLGQDTQEQNMEQQYWQTPPFTVTSKPWVAASSLTKPLSCCGLRPMERISSLPSVVRALTATSLNVAKILLFNSVKKLWNVSRRLVELWTTLWRFVKRLRSSGVIVRRCWRFGGTLTLWLSTYISQMPLFSSNILSVVPATWILVKVNIK